MTSLDAETPASRTGTLLDGVDITPLLAPVEPVPGLRLRNRFAMAPMTREFSPGGVPGPDVAAYYARRAATLGLIVTEGVYIDEPSAGTSSRVPHMYGDESLAGWKDVVDATHAAGSAIFPQLWHLGSVRRAGAEPNPQAPVVSPSGLAASGKTVGEPASLATIDGVIASFARAAVDAQRVGFDGVELHGAHGYLLDQFFWSTTNRRTDAYGGSVAARAKLAIEVVAAIRDAVGPGYPIQFRFSQWKGGLWDATIAADPGELEEILIPLAEAGVDIFHVSTRRYWLPAFAGSRRTLAGWTRQITGRPVVALGSIGVVAPFYGTDAEGQASLSLKPLVEIFERGEFDLVGLGRALLADPEWVGKLVAGHPETIRPYAKSLEATLF